MLCLCWVSSLAKLYFFKVSRDRGGIQRCQILYLLKLVIRLLGNYSRRLKVPAVHNAVTDIREIIAAGDI